jgi:hypothetical protein
MTRSLGRCLTACLRLGENFDPVSPLRKARQDMTNNQMVTHKSLNELHIVKREIDKGLSESWRYEQETT